MTKWGELPEIQTESQYAAIIGGVEVNVLRTVDNFFPAQDTGSTVLSFDRMFRILLPDMSLHETGYASMIDLSSFKIGFTNRSLMHLKRIFYKLTDDESDEVENPQQGERKPSMLSEEAILALTNYVRWLDIASFIALKSGIDIKQTLPVRPATLNIGGKEQYAIEVMVEPRKQRTIYLLNNMSGNGTVVLEYLPDPKDKMLDAKTRALVMFSALQLYVNAWLNTFNEEVGKKS